MTNQRLFSLDTFRGMTVALMIMVNNPGDWGHIYTPLEHAEWNGCTPTDLVFPFFLFMVGVAIPFALEKQKIDKLSFGLSIRKILIRSLKLFGLGLFLAAFPLLIFMEMSPLLETETEDTPSLFLRHPLETFTPGIKGPSTR